MDLILIFILSLVLFLRVVWLFVYKTSANIGFIIPLIFECIFVYPYLLVDILDLKWSFFGVVTMFLLALSLQIGFVLNVQESNQRVNIDVPNKLIYLMFFFLIIVILGISSNHADVLNNVSNVKSLLVVANQNAVSRYDSSLNVTLLYKVSSIFSFLLSLLLGVALATRKDKKIKLLFILFFIILFCDSILMAARAGFLLQLAGFLSAYLASKYVTNKRGYYQISLKKIFSILCFFVIIYSFFVVVQIARGGKEDFDIVSISSHVLTWFIGYLSAFDIWITQYYLFDHSYGLRTFSGLADFFSIHERSGGVYNAVEVKDGRVTNIYTAYRGLIEDFSLPLSFFIVLILGVMISQCVKMVVLCNSKIYFCMLIMFIYFVFWSFVINPYIYNTILFSTLMFFSFIYYFIKIEKV